MLLAIDVGNTNIAFGIYDRQESARPETVALSPAVPSIDNNHWTHHWRVRTAPIEMVQLRRSTV